MAAILWLQSHDLDVNTIDWIQWHGGFHWGSITIDHMPGALHVLLVPFQSIYSNFCPLLFKGGIVLGSAAPCSVACGRIGGGLGNAFATGLWMGLCGRMALIMLGG